MGILNVTPDSFSDGGNYNTIDAAVNQAEKILSDGAAILDIGGESTRPGADEVSTKDETERTIPVIEAIRKRHADACISIDTSKPESGPRRDPGWGCHYQRRYRGFVILP